ncbi:MAG: DUF2092 domain-containing protein [Pseudomonadota bacterium]
MIRRLLTIATLALLPMSAVAEDDDPPIDPKAAEIVKTAFDFLAGQPAVQVNWFITYDRIFEGRERVTFVRSGANTLARGKGFRSYAEHENQVREYVYDGQTFTVAVPERDFYARAPAAGDFDTLVDDLKERFDLVLPLWSIMSASSSGDFFADVERASYLGTTLINGRSAHHIAFSEYSEDFQVWIAADEERPVPLMIVGTDPYEQGWPGYHAYLYDWNFAPELGDDFFAFAPDENDIEIGFSNLAIDPVQGEPVKRDAQ